MGADWGLGGRGGVEDDEPCSGPQCLLFQVVLSDLKMIVLFVCLPPTCLVMFMLEFLSKHGKKDECG